MEAAGDRGNARLGGVGAGPGFGQFFLRRRQRADHHRVVAWQHGNRDAALGVDNASRIDTACALIGQECDFTHGKRIGAHADSDLRLGPGEVPMGNAGAAAACCEQGHGHQQGCMPPEARPKAGGAGIDGPECHAVHHSSPIGCPSSLTQSLCSAATETFSERKRTAASVITTWIPLGWKELMIVLFPPV